MAPILQDVSLLSLSLVGEAVGPRVVRPTWMAELVARFAGVDQIADFGPIIPHPMSARGRRRGGFCSFMFVYSRPYQLHLNSTTGFNFA